MNEQKIKQDIVQFEDSGKEQLNALEGSTTDFLNALEDLVMGVEETSVKDVDEMYKELKNSAKAVRSISLKYKKMLDEVSDEDLQRIKAEIAVEGLEEEYDGESQGDSEATAKFTA